MFQCSGVEACNWIVVDGARPGFRTIQEATREVAEFSASVRDLRVPTDEERADLPVFASLQIMTFDIECGSSHNAFPLARKTCRRPAHSIVDLAGRLPECDDATASVRRCVVARLRRAFDEGDRDGRLYPKGGRLLPREAVARRVRRVAAVRGRRRASWATSRDRPAGARGRRRRPPEHHGPPT